MKYFTFISIIALLTACSRKDEESKDPNEIRFNKYKKAICEEMQPQIEEFMEYDSTGKWKLALSRYQVCERTYADLIEFNNGDEEHIEMYLNLLEEFLIIVNESNYMREQEQIHLNLRKVNDDLLKGLEQAAQQAKDEQEQNLE